MPDDRPVSPEERLREALGLTLAELASAHRQAGRYSSRVDATIALARAALSAPAGPDWPREAEWRRGVMSEAKDALAGGDAKRAYEALTRHEREGYPWAPDHPSSAGPPR